MYFSRPSRTFVAMTFSSHETRIIGRYITGDIVARFRGPRPGHRTSFIKHSDQRGKSIYGEFSGSEDILSMKSTLAVALSGRNSDKLPIAPLRIVLNLLCLSQIFVFSVTSTPARPGNRTSDMRLIVRKNSCQANKLLSSAQTRVVGLPNQQSF